MSSRLGQMRGQYRLEAGVIITVENARGKTLSLHRSGRGALERACDDALSLDPTFRVVSISSPETILHDLSGHMPNRRTGEIEIPEWIRLGNIRRMAMIHPRIAPRGANSLRKHRGRGDSWE